MTPLPFRWLGDGFEPLRPRLADKQYIVDAVYNLVPVEDRSAASHNHYFACIAEAWANLPEEKAERWPSAEHLRKYALIQAGYRDERSIVAASKAEAQRLAAFIKPMDDFAVVLISDATVKVYTAKSQSFKAMGRKAFEESKARVLEFVASVLGVTVDELGKARAA